MGNWSVSRIKRVEFITVDSKKIKGHGCEACTLALNELRPIVDKLGVPLKIIETDSALAYPRTCIVKEEDNGEETANCILGWDETYAAEVEDLSKK